MTSNTFFCCCTFDNQSEREQSIWYKPAFIILSYHGTGQIQYQPPFVPILDGVLCSFLAIQTNKNIQKKKMWIMSFIFSFPDSRQRRFLTQFRFLAEAALRSQPPLSPPCQAPWQRSWGARASPQPRTSWSSSSGQMSRRRSLASWPRGPQTPRASHAEVTSTPWPRPRYWPLPDMTEGERVNDIKYFLGSRVPRIVYRISNLQSTLYKISCNVIWD